MKIVKYFTMFILALFVISCEKQQFKVSKNATTMMKSNPDYSAWDNQFLWGLVPTSTHDAVQICNGKEIEYIETKKDFFTGLLTGLSYGVYTPRVWSVQCSSK
jgi:hypothetical protein